MWNEWNELNKTTEMNMIYLPADSQRVDGKKAGVGGAIYANVSWWSLSSLASFSFVSSFVAP